MRIVRDQRPQFFNLRFGLGQGRTMSKVDGQLVLGEVLAKEMFTENRVLVALLAREHRAIEYR